MIEVLRDQILVQKHLQRKMLETQQRSSWMVPKKTRNDSNNVMSNNAILNPKTQLPKHKPLLALFLEHIDNMKRELRQRKVLSKLQNVKATKINVAHLKNTDISNQISVS